MDMKTIVVSILIKFNHMEEEVAKIVRGVVAYFEIIIKVFKILIIKMVINWVA